MHTVYLHPSSLEHDTGSHPERAARLQAVFAELEACDWLGWDRVLSPAVSRDVLRRVHPDAYVESIERACATGRRALDADTFISAGSWEAALHSAGGAVAMVDDLLRGPGGSGGADGSVGVGFSIHRPPGHHAPADRAMGFCLFNNIAVAARHAVADLGLERVLILDWDVHHGNGTQDILWEDDSVLFISIHQSPLYPGSGRVDEIGAGAGRGYTINLPVPPGTGDHGFVSLVRDVAVPLASAFAPQLILVSAGFDAHADDPLASCSVSDAGFVTMASVVRSCAASLGVPLGLVLEGGYDIHALARSVAGVMQELTGVGPLADHLDEAVVDPLATRARERLAPLWPTLG